MIVYPNTSVSTVKFDVQVHQDQIFYMQNHYLNANAINSKQIFVSFSGLFVKDAMDIKKNTDLYNGNASQLDLVRNMMAKTLCIIDAYKQSDYGNIKTDIKVQKYLDPSIAPIMDHMEVFYYK